MRAGMYRMGGKWTLLVTSGVQSVPFSPFDREAIVQHMKDTIARERGC